MAFSDHSMKYGNLKCSKKTATGCRLCIWWCLWQLLCQGTQQKIL